MPKKQKGLLAEEIFILRMLAVLIAVIMLILLVGCTSNATEKESVCRAKCKKCEELIIECRRQHDSDNTELTP